ncbi:MAG: C2H2-type zinc finger protein [Candidatus Bathyarchaeota archaeon]|nr:C2H2-type zinc finger protein [Candidatus Bathyarchaeota archaeon]
MAAEDKVLGVVSQVGIERDDAEYNNFNLHVGIRVKTDKKLSYYEGERLIKLLRKELLGKNIELEAISVPCPICGKTFNSETGMKQHIRRQHDGEEPPIKKGRAKKTTRKRSAKKK